MKTLQRTVLATLLALSANYASAVDTASWTLWDQTTMPTTTPTGTLVQNGDTITVTYSGDHFAGDQRAAIFDYVPTSFTTATITNTPGANGTIDMTGGTPVGGAPTLNDFHFSQAVIDPIIAVWSVGQGNVPVTFNFQDPFTIVSQGAGDWGGGLLVQSTDSVTGWEGNGLLQFNGSFTDIFFTTPNSEYYYGATVGALTSTAPVPEPETYAMMLAGLGILGFIARRRKA